MLFEANRLSIRSKNAGTPKSIFARFFGTNRLSIRVKNAGSLKLLRAFFETNRLSIRAKNEKGHLNYFHAFF